MPRTIKTLKDDTGNSVEVYWDNCNICNTDMYFPKDEADRMETAFPFLKDIVERGSPCVECAKKQAETDSFNLFSEQEINMIKEFVLKGS